MSYLCMEIWYGCLPVSFVVKGNEWDKLEIVKTHPLKTIKQVQRTCTCKLGSKFAGIMNN